MRHGPRREDNGAFTCIVVMGVALFTGGLWISYSLGTGQAAHHKDNTATTMARQVRVRAQIKECTESITSRPMAGAEDEKTMALRQEHQKLEHINEKLTKSTEKLHTKALDCAEITELKKQQWSEEDIKNAKRVSELRARHSQLIVNSTKYTNTQGMRMILLDASIRKLKAENDALNRALGNQITQSPEDLLKSLVEKWASSVDDDKLVLPHVGHEFNHSLSRPKTTWVYDTNRVVQSKIFFQTKNSAGTYEKPSWLGRVGTQKLKSGVHDTNYISSLGLSKQIRVLYDYALCAMGNNATFIYPTHFRASTGSDVVSSLVNILETPLVDFCVECKPQERTGEFQLACQGYSAAEQYGSLFFWRMRSRIRFTDEVLQRADEWMATNGFENALAVRLKRGAFASECNLQLKRNVPLPAYRVFAKQDEAHAQDEGALHTCYPDEAYVIKTVNTLVSRTRVNKVYFSSDATDEEWASLTKHINVPIGRLPAPSNADEAASNAVDIVIASKMKAVLLNRYDLTSTQMGELHYLENNLSPKTISFW